MTLSEEYRKQAAWRSWDQALGLLPLRPGQRILDLGCGVGDVCSRLAARGADVIGIDSNRELLETARGRFPEIQFIEQDITNLSLPEAHFDGIWSSFTAAYFADPEPVVARWVSLLKSSAWICLIDIDDLLGHEPLPREMHDQIGNFYVNAVGRYDFHVGRKLEGMLKKAGCQTSRSDLRDAELSFQGVANADVLQAWRDRFARMGGLRNFLGREYPRFEAEFLGCLTLPEHQSLCRVVCCVGVRA